MSTSVISCLFLGEIFALSLMVSSYVRDSATSLIICLFGWLLGGVGCANVLPSLSAFGIKERPIQEFWDGDRELWDRFNRDLEAWEERNPSPGPTYLKGCQKDECVRYGHPLGYAWLQKRNAYRLDKLLARTSESTKLIWPAPHIHQGMRIEKWALSGGRHRGHAASRFTVHA